MTKVSIIADAPTFCISTLAQIVTQLADQHHDDLLDLSPLTSPDSTPSNSPQSSSIRLPALDDFQPPTSSNAQRPFPSQSMDTRDAREKRKAVKKEKGHANRCKRHALEKAVNIYAPPRPEAEHKYLFRHPPTMSSNDTSNNGTTKGSYVAKRSLFENKCLYGLDDLVGPSSTFNFHLQEWDGSTPTPIVDTEGHVISVLAVLHAGVSHGGGQTQPGTLHNNHIDEAIIEGLNATEPFKRLAGFSSSDKTIAIFATWAPKLHEYYRTTKEHLQGKYPHLRWPFSGSVFSAVSYNLGPATVCFPHANFGNLPFGWCSLTALGSFDHTKGGHLVLWDCGLVIQFPTGSTILFPSALIAHSNTTIGANERQYSVTQYTAGGIF